MKTNLKKNWKGNPSNFKYSCTFNNFEQPLPQEHTHLSITPPLKGTHTHNPTVTPPLIPQRGRASLPLTTGEHSGFLQSSVKSHGGPPLPVKVTVELLSLWRSQVGTCISAPRKQNGYQSRHTHTHTHHWTHPDPRRGRQRYRNICRALTHLKTKHTATAYLYNGLRCTLFSCFCSSS